MEESRFDSGALEFDIFINIIKKTATSAFFKNILTHLVPENDITEILKHQTCINEALSLVKSLDINIYDDTKFFHLYKKLFSSYYYLTNTDFLILKDFLYCLLQIKNIFTKQRDYSNLQEITSNIDPHYEFYEKLNKTFDEDGNIKDSASEKLYHIRVNILKERKKIFNELNNIINSNKAKFFIADTIITERWSRFLLLCKPSYRQYIDGILQDISNSGQSCYVEPLTVVELNNNYRALKIEEDDEIKHIINCLNKDFYEIFSSLKETINFYEKLIYYLSLALFFKNLPIVFPVFTERIKFSSIHHPLIFLKKANNSVPIDFIMDIDKYLAVITGPNAGGKTAAIKSIALNCLIAKCGFPLFGVYAEVKNFSSILCDIGDNQSILNDLSSFVSHLVNINKIINCANNDTLVIMDEPGASTDPRKGVALSIAVIEELMNRRTKILVSTHFEEIKELAIADPKASIFATSYDYEQMIPKYNLINGISGDSSPFVIAEKYKLKKDIILRAKQIYEKNYTENQRTLDELRALLFEYKKKNILIDSVIKNLEALLNELIKRKENINNELCKQKEEILKQAYSFLERSRKYCNKRQISQNLETINKDITEVESQLEVLKNTHNYIKDISIGDHLILDQFNKEVEIIDVDNERVLINLDNKKIYMDKRDLIGKKIKKQNDNNLDIQKNVNQTMPPEINLIGKTVEEAIDILEKHIDKMLLSGVSHFYIIHGRGTGVLRRGIHEFLKNYRFIKSFQIASYEEGGDAVTVVNL